MAVVSTDYINTGGGKLYIEPFIAGVLSGVRTYFGITENINLTTDAEYLEHQNSETAIFKTDKKVQKSIGATITFGTAEISIDMLNRAYSGTKKVLSQAVTTAEAVSIVGVKIGGTYDIGFYGITSLADAVFVENVDYTYDAGSGMITVLEGGTITDDDDFSLTIDADAFEGSLMAGLTGESLEARLTFVSAPLAGKRFKYTFKKVAIAASGDLSLKGDEFMVLNFEGSALSDETVVDATLSDYFDIEEIAV